MKKELKEQIKQDEFASGLEQGIAWIGAHRDEVRIGAGVVAVLLAAGGAFAYFQGQRSREADRQMRDALTTFEAPVAAELSVGADRPSGQIFATAEDKYKTAAAAFEGLERRYGSSATGLRAKYYAALSRVELGQFAEAEKALKDVQARGGGLEPELARVALANLYRRSGQVEKAVEAYRGLATNPSANVPRDFALLSAAQTLEDAKRWAEARTTYRQLLEQFPASVYAPEARARADYLQTAS
ncbi:MAG TPA: tetratricopeptide repeat protein [Vicinamibacteria bacterium]|nr:tetratricopeptide repeat protein [Vicinamibacteria bacterium]